MKDKGIRAIPIFLLSTSIVLLGSVVHPIFGLFLINPFSINLFLKKKKNETFLSTHDFAIIKSQ